MFSPELRYSSPDSSYTYRCIVVVVSEVLGAVGGGVCVLCVIIGASIQYKVVY